MKRAFDVVLAAAALLPLAPLLLVVALAVRIGSRGPVFFHADRVGRGGRRFRMHKFRTMSADVGGARITTSNDPRVTSIGRVLRATHLDEAPQLWNVLAGEMSLVGPRPEDPAFVDVDDPAWRRVLSVRPGITGPTQLRFADLERASLGDIDPERDYRERVLPAKLRADVDYVERQTLLGDVVLLLRTPFARAGASA
jgi:lipopolysaccharide/colanic/teichoic acid biosynthesis glycosyltransferase